MSATGAASASASRLRALANLARSPADLWLAARTVAWMCALPLLKRMLPLPKLVRLMWRSPRAERSFEREQRTIQIVARLSRTAGGNCLERSLILYRYLSRANAEPRLVIGMARPDEYLGHVWVTVDGQPLLETSETLRAYEVVTAFDDEGRRAE